MEKEKPTAKKAKTVVGVKEAAKKELEREKSSHWDYQQTEEAVDALQGILTDTDELAGAGGESEDADNADDDKLENPPEKGLLCYYNSHPLQA